MFEACSDVFAFMVLAFAALVISVAAAFRSALSKPPRVRLEARLVADPAPGLELGFFQESRKAVQVESVNVPRSAAEALGLRPPTDFTKSVDSVPSRESFEADFEPFIQDNPNPTDAEIDAEIDREYAETVRLAKQIEAERVIFRGRLTVLRGRVETLLVPAERLAEVSGTVSAMFSYRTGFVSAMESTSVELPAGRPS